jgi:predicted nucleic acid-binding protein
MKAKLYLESTVPSYLVARQSRDIVTAGHQATTREWWEKRRDDFHIFVSEVVVAEVSRGEKAMADLRLGVIKDFPRLAVTDEVKELAQSLIVSGGLPKKAVNDAAHIALAAVHEMHFLMTWNCRHIANAEMLRKVQSICRAHSTNCPVVCTPEELMGTA